MAKKGYSTPDFFGGGYTHYDEKGNKIGRSEPHLFDDGSSHYDNNGHKAVNTWKNLMTGYCSFIAYLL